MVHLNRFAVDHWLRCEKRFDMRVKQRWRPTRMPQRGLREMIEYWLPRAILAPDRIEHAVDTLEELYKTRGVDTENDPTANHHDLFMRDRTALAGVLAAARASCPLGVRLESGLGLPLPKVEIADEYIYYPSGTLVGMDSVHMFRVVGEWDVARAQHLENDGGIHLEAMVSTHNRPVQKTITVHPVVLGRRHQDHYGNPTCRYWQHRATSLIRYESSWVVGGRTQRATGNAWEKVLMTLEPMERIIDHAAALGQESMALLFPKTVTFPTNPGLATDTKDVLYEALKKERYVKNWRACFIPDDCPFYRACWGETRPASMISMTRLEPTVVQFSM